MNMGSYNYLGFAQTTGPCADDAEHVTLTQGVGVCSSRHELGMRTWKCLLMQYKYINSL
jgi:serine palmitoyltransferase